MLITDFYYFKELIFINLFNLSGKSTVMPSVFKVYTFPIISSSFTPHNLTPIPLALANAISLEVTFVALGHI